MKKLIALIAFTIVGCSAVTSTPTPDVIAEAMQAVVSIEFEADEGKPGRVHCSGIAYAPGKIITNAHCTSLDDNRRYTIRFLDGTAAKGYLIGRATDFDAAVISVDPRATKHLARVSTVAPVTGEKVFVVGHPFGLRWSVSAGIVSNADRTINSGDPELDSKKWYQVDASINPGNSGGALFNAAGELIGVPTLKYNADGIGFALPIVDFLAALAPLGV